MTVYTVTRKTQSWYGEQIGILILDAAYPCIPGNVGNGPWLWPSAWRKFVKRNQSGRCAI